MFVFFWLVAFSAISAGANSSVQSGVFLCTGDSISQKSAPKDYQKCAGNQVRFATRSGCVRGFEEAGGDSWKDTRPTVALHSKNCRSIVVSCVDPVTQRAQIGCYSEMGSGTYWVNLEELDCAPMNVSKYVPLPTPALRHDCDSDGRGFSSSPLRGVNLVDGAFPATALQQCVLKIARKKFQAMQLAVQGEDNLKLWSIYNNMSPAEVSAALAKAVVTLRERFGRVSHSKLFGPNCEGTPKLPAKADLLETDVTQGQRTCRLIRDAALVADHLDPSALTAEEAKRRFQDILVGGAVSLPFADNAQLALRTVMLEGLEKKPKLLKQRENGEFPRLERALKLKVGPSFSELHNGYTFGGERMDGRAGGIDCSEFVSKVFGLSSQITDERSGKLVPRVPSTAQLQQIMKYSAGETKVLPPAPWDSFVTCFKAVAVRGGEWPQPGDVVVRRQGKEGHVVLVESYDPSDPYAVKTIEAGGGSFNTLAQNRRELFEEACVRQGVDDAPAVRSGLTVVRYVGGKNCPANPPVDECRP